MRKMPGGGGTGERRVVSPPRQRSSDGAPLSLAGGGCSRALPRQQADAPFSSAASAQSSLRRARRRFPPRLHHLSQRKVGASAIEDASVSTRSHGVACDLLGRARLARSGESRARVAAPRTGETSERTPRPRQAATYSLLRRCLLPRAGRRQERGLVGRVRWSPAVEQLFMNAGGRFRGVAVRRRAIRPRRKRRPDRRDLALVAGLIK